MRKRCKLCHQHRKRIFPAATTAKARPAPESAALTLPADAASYAPQMTYADAIQYLSELQKFGARFGLETTQQLAAAFANPQSRLRFIHVAGTNGKGSTCAMLESIYRAAGLRVGLFTSPHLISFRERIQINRQLISESAVARLVSHLAARQPKLEPTFFEFVTVLALEYFSDECCDLVIWETGLGGRLDATNIVTPLASVITNVSLDHEAWLGDTVEIIAAEKAGIIKPGVPVITAAEHPAALAVVRETAAQRGAPMTVVTRVPEGAETMKERVSLGGEHQLVNAALARATVATLQNQIPISETAINRGLATVEWPGRLQLVARPQGRRMLMDGAHNAAGAAVLRRAVTDGINGIPSSAQEITLILGIMGDKNWRLICDQLAPLAMRIHLVPLATERTAIPEELARCCRLANPAAAVVVQPSVKDALAAAVTAPFTIVTGSLYLVGEVLRLISDDPMTDESALNQWHSGRLQP